METKTDLLLANAVVDLLQDPAVRRLDSDQKDLESRLLRFVKDPWMFRNVNPSLCNKDLLDLVLDYQVAKLFRSGLVKKFSSLKTTTSAVTVLNPSMTDWTGRSVSM